MKHDFNYFFKEGAGNMFSHGFMSFAAIGITVACLLIMGTFSLVAFNLNENLKDLQRENAVLAFVDEALSETEARLDSDVFFRCHKSYIINLNHISNITPYGRWTYIVRLNGTEHDALITHEKYEELERMFS